MRHAGQVAIAGYVEELFGVAWDARRNVAGRRSDDRMQPREGAAADDTLASDGAREVSAHETRAADEKRYLATSSARAADRLDHQPSGVALPREIIAGRGRPVTINRPT
jgi:hypothetical protein